MPSRGDNSPNVIHEAKQFGLPIIATDVGGNNELVKNDYNGFLIQLTDDVGVLKNAILNFFKQSQFKQINFGENSIKLALNEFSIEKMCESYLSLYVK